MLTGEEGGGLANKIKTKDAGSAEVIDPEKWRERRSAASICGIDLYVLCCEKQRLIHIGGAVRSSD